MKKILPPLFLLAVLALFVAQAILLDRASLAFVRSASPRDTLVGLPEPRFFTDPDAYAWLCHARDMLLAGDWRIRHTHMDNAPYGRSMHWSHLLIWELAAHARLLQRLHPGMLLSPALEIAGRCAMPFFFLLFIPPLYFLYLRKLGFLPAAVFALSSAVFPFFAEIFTPLQPDHHVFQYLFPLVTVTALAFGGWGRVSTAPPSGNTPRPFWIRPLQLPSPASARRWFLLAGAAHACLLWIGASVWLVVHCALCLAVLSALAPPAADSRPAPRLWFSFLASSLPLSVAFYLLEYAPRFPGMRLEVNHPLYWLFLLGSALALARLSFLREFLSPATWRRFLLPALLALPLPLALLFGPASWHALHDPFLARLHARHIAEFLPYSGILREHPFQPFVYFRLFLLPLVATPVLAFASSSRISSDFKHILRPCALLNGIFLFLLFVQRRWHTPLAATLLLSSLLCLAWHARTPANGMRRPLGKKCLHFLSRCPGAIVAVLLVLWLSDAIWQCTRSILDCRAMAKNIMTPDTWVDGDLYKRAALRIAADAAGQDWIFAGNVSVAPVLYYFGGTRSIASLYWENADGWHTEASLLSSPADAIPPDLLDDVRARGLTHVLVNHEADFPELYLDVATGARDPVQANRETLDGRLHSVPLLPAPSPFAPDPALTESLSRTNLYALPHKGPLSFAPAHLPWTAFDLLPAENAVPASMPE